jgi:hypothetical protein
VNSPSKAVGLIKRVRGRLLFAAIGLRLFLAFVGASIAYAVALLVSRFLGVIPQEWFGWESLAVIPAAAIVITTVWHRRPSTEDAARRIDHHAGTKDLFLTMTMLETAAGEYRPLVSHSAEAKAANIRPSLVVPFEGAERFAYATAAVLVLALGIWKLPQFDPFGKVQAATEIKQRVEKLAESKKATEQRAAQLKRHETSDEDVSPEVKAATDELKAAFRKMKPLEKGENLKTLVREQKILGEMWRRISAEKLKDLLNQSNQNQQFGAAENPKLQKWTKELQEGSTESLQQHLDQIMKDVQQLANTEDPTKRAELEQKIKKELKELQQLANDKLNSKPLNAALERAMKQLESSKMEDLKKDALDALEKSMELTKLELKEIAQSAKDMKQLEEALKTIQMAKALNDKEKLDGEETEDAQTIEDYAELYAQMMAEMGEMAMEEGEGEGEGENDTQRGEGSDPEPEDDSVITSFKAEQSKSQIVAGKVLMSIKSKGLSDSGEAVKQYEKQLGKVKQGVSEAILQEQIPPGYVDGIKNYFDTLEKAAPGGLKQPKSVAPEK